MRLNRRLSWIAMSGLALALVLILSLLYVRTQAHDPSSYFENVSVLRQLKQLDARWELDVLKSKMGINTNYDSLADPLVELNQLRQQLQRDIDSQVGVGTRAVTELNEAFRPTLERKTQLIEHFKSHNSVLRNSLAFLPTATLDVENAVGDSKTSSSTPKTFIADVNRVLLDTEVFSQAPSDEKAAEIQLEVDRLTDRAARLPQLARDGVDIFSAHVRTVLREQPEVNRLLESIAEVPTSASIDAIDNELSRAQREAELQVQQYRKYLLIFAAALAGLFLYAAVRLIRSHAVINRVNHQLQLANTTLEQRVHERTRELMDAQTELVSTARQAGMAEIANNVLHNVGNVLTSVNVSAGIISERLRDSKSLGLAKATQLMNDRAADLADFLTRDERGKILPGYLHKLAVTIAAERENVIEELRSMTRSIDHIKEIVATQQSYSGATSVVEPVQVTDLMEDALRMNVGSIDRHRIDVIKEFASVPPVLLDKHLVLQILINLIRNAKQAMDQSPELSHRLTLRTAAADTGDGLLLRISVEDNGEGIAPEILTRLFTHGFTTRKSGHGFGLHSCALAAKEMRGAIVAHSEGRGHGATFTLELPVRLAESVPAYREAMVA